MIANMLAGNSPSVDYGALISSLNTGTKVSKYNGSQNEDPGISSDFASLLNQTMDSKLSSDSQGNKPQSNLKDTVSSISSSFFKSSLGINTIGSSSVMKLAERSSAQKSYYGANSSINKNNAQAAAQKKEQTAPQEEKAVEKDSTAEEVSEKDTTEDAQNSENKEKIQELMSEVSVELSESINAEVTEEEASVEGEEELEKISDITAENTSILTQANTEEKEEVSATEEVQSNVVSKKNTGKNLENATEENSEGENLEGAEESAIAENTAPKDVKSEEKSEKDSKFNEIVEALSKNKEVVPEESLRKEFAKATGQEKAAEEAANNEAIQQNIAAEQQAPQNAVSHNIAPNEGSLDSYIVQQTEKSANYENKTSKSGVTAVAGFDIGSKATNQSHNNPGNNSGFSFNSGTSQNYDSNGKVAQTPHTPATTTNFADLLNKAEMVKTKDGAKIMSVETEQEGIGKLEMELISKDGEVTAKLSAENELSKVKLEELTSQIKDSLQEKGINLTQISVDVSSRDADRNSNEYLNSGKRNKSARLSGIEDGSASEVTRENILPNLRRQALNIQSVDITV